jgi:type I restriction enzyme S subunit
MIDLSNTSKKVLTVRLGDITTKIGSGATPRGGKESYKPHGISLIRSMNVHDSNFDYSDLAYIDEAQAKSLDNVTVEENDVLLNITGASVARCCMAPKNVLPARVNQHVAIVRSKKAQANPFFIHYCLVSPYYKDHLLSIAQGGATREALTKEKLEDFRIPFPPLPTQRKIVAILSAYDDLIENNKRRIRILEEMAQALYREWFVHFRFPGHESIPLVDSPLGPIPEGWAIKKVSMLVQRISPGKLYETKTILDSGSIPVLDQGKSGIIGYHNDSSGVEASRTIPIIVFANHTCYQRMIFFPFSSIQNVIPFVPSAVEERNVYWLYFTTKDLVVLNDYKRHWPEFINKETLVPPAQLSEEFGENVEDLMYQTHILYGKNNLLRRTRDLLLPKLISGELSIPQEVDE